MKKYVIIIIGLAMLVSVGINAQKSPDKVLKSIKHEWFFSSIDVPGKNPFVSERDLIAPDDSCQKYTSYNFLDGGKVEVKNNDASKCRYKTEVKYWTLITLHSNKGKAYNGIRITEEAAPERDNYDMNTYNDEIYLIVFVNNNNLQLVAKPQYKTANLDRIANYFRVRTY